MTPDNPSAPVAPAPERVEVPRPAEAAEPEVRPNRRLRRLAAVLLALLLAEGTVGAYWRTFQSDFVNYDDNVYVYDNPHVQAGLTADGARWSLTTTDNVNWHPLTWMSFQLDSSIWSVHRPFGFHLTNMALHVANALLLFWALTWMTGKMGRSAFVAALFALHPQHVESVAWVTERKDVLSAFFWMLAMLAYAWYAERPRWWNYLLVVLAFALGLTAKSMLVTLPCVFLLLDYWPLRRYPWQTAASDGRPAEGFRPAPTSWLRLILEKVPLLALSAASTAVTMYAQQKGGETNPMSAMPLRIANALVAYATYAGKTVWPVGLVPFYPFPTEDDYAWFYAVEAGLLLAGVTILAVAMVRRRPYFAVGWFWFLGTLTPVIGIIQVIGGYSMADRFSYIPLIGLFLAAVWGAADAAGRAGVRAWAAAAAGVAVLVGFAAGTWQQVGYWHDSFDLWNHTLEVNPRNWLAYNNLGHAYLLQGKLDTAEGYFRKAIDCNYGFHLAHFTLGWTLWQEGRPDAAIAEYEEAVRLYDKDLQYQYTLGWALLNRGKVAEALPHYQAALALDPNYAPAHSDLGRTYFWEGRTADAVQEYQAALRANPNSAEVHTLLAQALLAQGDAEAALAECDAALGIDPNYADAHDGRGAALMKQGKALEGAQEKAKAEQLRQSAKSP